MYETAPATRCCSGSLEPGPSKTVRNVMFGQDIPLWQGSRTDYDTSKLQVDHAMDQGGWRAHQRRIPLFCVMEA